MAFDGLFDQRIQEVLHEKGFAFSVINMMGGRCYMVDGKMCCGTFNEKHTQEILFLARIGEVQVSKSQDLSYVHDFTMAGRVSKGFVTVSATDLSEKIDLEIWIQKCLAFNPEAKSSKKKK